MEDGTILDSQLTASSIWNLNYPPYTARLYHGVSWYASQQSQNVFQWIQADFGGTVRYVSGLITQPGPSGYVTSYNIEYSTDDIVLQFVKDDDNNQTKVRHLFHFYHFLSSDS